MKLEELSQYDSSFELKKSSKDNQEVFGVTNFEYPKDEHFVFIKDLSFFKKIKDKLTSSHKKMGLICSKVVYEEEESFLTNSFGWIGTSGNIDLSMCQLSRAFYDLKYTGLNFELDGRQSGRAELHPTAWIAQGVFIGEGCSIAENLSLIHI